MQFALVDNRRIKATPKQEAVCELCGKKVISKCGEKNVWHWSHVASINCDPWWENETGWHREWKSFFPEHSQEVVHLDQKTGEKHIADVKTDNDMVIEFQNSPLSKQELDSRERFYGNMFWVVNGEKFKNRFSLGSKLPPPDAFEMENIQIAPMNDKRSFLIWRLSENPNLKEGDLVEMYSSGGVEDLINDSFDGHFLFNWKNKRSVWFDASRPVFLDFGSDYLFRLKLYGRQNLFCVKAVAKKRLVELNGGLMH